MSEVRIRPAVQAADVEVARSLFDEYVRTLGVDLSFQGVAEEFATLPGAYAPPRGAILLAERDGAVVGCIALRPLAASQEGEVKRLYVRPTARGSGAGEALVHALVDVARASGYTLLKLDTLGKMEAARRLYARMGFAPCPPYYRNPLPGVVYMSRTLQE